MTTTKDRFAGSNVYNVTGSADEIATLRAELSEKGYHDVTSTCMAKSSFGRSTYYRFEVK